MPLNIETLNDAQKAIVAKISEEDLAALEGMFKPARKRSYTPRIGLKTVLNLMKTTCTLPQDDCDVDSALCELASVLEVYFAGKELDNDRMEVLATNEMWCKAKDQVKQGAVLAYVKHLQKISRKKRKTEAEAVETVENKVTELPDFDDDEFEEIDVAAATGVPL